MTLTVGQELTHELCQFFRPSVMLVALQSSPASTPLYSSVATQGQSHKK